MQNQVSVTPAAAGKRGLACGLLFALPFAGLGLLGVVMGIRAYGKQPNAISGIIVGGIFAAIGIGLIVAIVVGARSGAKTDSLKAQHPNKPWLWRDDWSRGIIKDSNAAGTIGMWIFALIWNGVSLPIAYFATRQVDRGQPLIYLIYLFPLVGLFILIAAIYGTLGSMKFGTSECHLEHVPIVPGRVFRGHIVTKQDLNPADGFRLRLMSLRYITVRSGRNRSTDERLLWDAQTIVPASAAMRSPMGTRIPFQFATPPDSQVTDESNYSDRYIWRIAATADIPGVDYSTTFDVPVFRTGEAVDGSEYAAFEERHRVEAARLPIKAASGVQITALPSGGEEFRLEAKKTFGSVLKSLIFIAVWNAAIVAMIHFGAPWIITGFFILIDVLLFIGSVDYFFGRTTIGVDAAGVRVQKQWFGFKSANQFEAASISAIEGTTPSPNSQTFGLTLKLQDGRKLPLTSKLPDRESADIVAAKMMSNLKRSTG